jgi:hypothetical protein
MSFLTHPLPHSAVQAVGEVVLLHSLSRMDCVLNYV